MISLPAMTDSISSPPPLRGVSSMATRLVLAELLRDWHAEGREPVALESIGGVEAARRVASGEPFDWVVLASDALQQLAAQGHVQADTCVPLVRSPVAVAVPAGFPRPDLGSVEGVRQAVLGARRLGVSTGPSGQALQQLFERWGLGAQVRARLVIPPPGVPVGSLLARGEIDLGFQQLSELMHIPGIQVVGTLPPPVAIETVFSGAATACCTRTDAVRRLLAFLAAPAAAAAKRRHGMEPALAADDARKVWTHA
ncbi:MAG: substrate-binding domain-containing protein [Tepidimonas sp.]|nr:substrate-binding domain-containing protein [Tepidimonas sp.]